MKLILYKVVDGENVIGKVKTDGLEIDINFKNDVDVLRPNILLSVNDSVNLKEYNYAYIHSFERYYYVDVLRFVNSRIIEIELTVDVLETYKDDILTSHARVMRNIKTGDYMDVKIDTSVTQTVNKYVSDFTLVEGESTVILSVIGE